MIRPSEHENLWKIVENTRKSYLSEVKEWNCHASNTLISDEDMKFNVDKIALNTSMNPNNTQLTNVTYETLEVSAKMFIYLTYCPSKFTQVYKNLFTQGSPQKIIKTMIDILRGTIKAKTENMKIWNAIIEKLYIHHFHDIDNCSKMRNNCTMNVDEYLNVGKTLDLRYF